MLFYTLHVLIVLLGGFLLLKKVAEMDGHHGLRVIVLTAIFSVPVILLFLLYVNATLNPSYTICVDVR